MHKMQSDVFRCGAQLQPSFACVLCLTTRPSPSTATLPSPGPSSTGTLSEVSGLPMRRPASAVKCSMAAVSQTSSPHPLPRSTLNAYKMLGFVTCVWLLAFFMALPQVFQTYATWPDEYEDVVCPLSAVRGTPERGVLRTERPIRSETAKTTKTTKRLQSQKMYRVGRQLVYIGLGRNL